MSTEPLKMTESDQPGDENMTLSPDERAEGDRFKQLTMQRAKKRAVIQKLIVRLRQKDRFSKAA
jgi:hypothetical protein